MANSKNTMGRLSRLESNVAELKTDVRELKTDVRELKTTAWRMAEMFADHRLAVTERLDRLIAVTMQERTANAERLGENAERLGEIERRLARLEERVGV